MVKYHNFILVYKRPKLSYPTKLRNTGINTLRQYKKLYQIKRRTEMVWIKEETKYETKSNLKHNLPMGKLYFTKKQRNYYKPPSTSSNLRNPWIIYGQRRTSYMQILRVCLSIKDNILWMSLLSNLTSQSKHFRKPRYLSWTKSEEK